MRRKAKRLAVKSIIRMNFDAAVANRAIELQNSEAQPHIQTPSTEESVTTNVNQ